MRARAARSAQGVSRTRLRTKILRGLAVVVALGLAGFFVFAPSLVESRKNATLRPPPYRVSADAAALHARLTVVDLHTDTLLWDRDPLARSERGQVDLPRLVEAGVALQAFTVVTQVPRGMNYDRNSDDSDSITALFVAQLRSPRTWLSLKARALDQAADLRQAADRSGGALTLIRSVADLDALLERRQRDPKLVGAILGLEGAHALEGELAAVDELFAAGFRMMAPVHFFDNALGGSAHGVEQGGLSELGVEVLERQQALGMLVDVSHGSPALVDEVLARATKPVLSSHTGVRGTCDNRRNLSDEHVRGIAATGGVVGIGFWEAATCGTDASAIARAIRYAVDLVGPQHVALGSDFDGAVPQPFDVTGLPLITEALLAEGFGEAEIAAIMGGNTLRVLRAALPR